MPIYEYRCSSCGAQKDVLQKINDAPLVNCPVCQQATFTKQISAAGFQLKGSGWYATDFKNSGSKPQPSTQGKSEVPVKSETSAKSEMPTSNPVVVANT